MGCTCNSLKSISTVCGEYNMGGIKRVIVACATDVTIAEKTGEGNEGYATVTVESGKSTYLISFRKQSSNFSSEMTIDDANGISFATTTLEIVLAKMNRERRNAVMGLLQSEMVAFVEDNNGNYWALGKDNVVTATNGGFSSGTNSTDPNAMNVTLTDISTELPLMLDADSIAAITASGTLVE